MTDTTEIRTIALRCEEPQYVRAEEDFPEYTRPYAATIWGTLHLSVNGRDVEHENRLPARVDLADTARAQYEMLWRLDRVDEYRGVPFCCVCSNRGCTGITWEVTRREDGALDIEMRDTIGDSIGDGRYVVASETLAEAAVALVEEVLAFMEAESLERLPWADRKDGSDLPRNDYASRHSLEECARILRSTYSLEG